MLTLISFFGWFAAAWRSQPLPPCSPEVHGWPFYFGTLENCDGHIEHIIILWVLAIGYLITTLVELRLWLGGAYDNGRIQGKLEILAKLAKLDGEKRLEATEKLLRDYRTPLEVFEENEKFSRDHGLVEKVVEEDKNLLIDLGVIEKVAEEDLEKDLEKGTLLIEL
ncbi:hypothetical protein BGAL_0587g00010 [Botrytis galanthina]|uniref:Uncharacterized protein n=1 Tax=Botrytis galanthina TaxID=278940 RepID=A0A4S8QIX5_9HELO|nr:hypothetical protein BGAL_0587g00010 [Botrytis galanthina]